MRFGNVLGSRGSVIPTFQRQIAAGGPVTVTDPRMTRFFMSIREAVTLVLQAPRISQDGEVLHARDGRAGQHLRARRADDPLCGYEVGTDIDIEITGMRPGERLTEQLRGKDERVEATSHPSIVAVGVVRLQPERLDGILTELGHAIERRDNDAARVRLLSSPAAATPAPGGSTENGSHGAGGSAAPGSRTPVHRT